jgi:hypothetical protein
MFTEKHKLLHRGPMPPWPANLGFITWLEMSIEVRAQLFRQLAEKEGFSEADRDRMIRYWDHQAALLAMDSQERAAQIRRDMERAWEGFPQEIEPQTQRRIKAWDEIVASGR